MINLFESTRISWGDGVGEVLWENRVFLILNNLTRTCASSYLLLKLTSVQFARTRTCSSTNVSTYRTIDIRAYVSIVKVASIARFLQNVLCVMTILNLRSFTVCQDLGFMGRSVSQKPCLVFSNRAISVLSDSGLDCATVRRVILTKLPWPFIRRWFIPLVRDGDLIVLASMKKPESDLRRYDGPFSAWCSF